MLPALPAGVRDFVFADDADAGTFHVVPEAPVIGRTAGGEPSLRLLKYRSPGETGGLLELRSELVLDPGRAQTLRESLAAGGRSVRLRAPHCIDASAELITLAPSSGGPVESVTGSAAPTLDLGNRAVFSVALSPAGAALFWRALHDPAPASPLLLRYRLTFLARLPAGRVRVWLHGDPSGGPGGTPAERRDALVASGGAGVEVLDWPAGLDGLRQEVTAWGMRFLEEQVRSPGHADVELVLNARSVIPWTVRPQGVLAVPELAGCLHEIDIGDPIFQRLEVESCCNADFAGDGIHSIRLRLRYGAARHEAVFTGNDGSDVFRTVVDPALGDAYAYDAVVQFAGSAATVTLPERTATGRYLVLAPGPVGRLKIDVDGGLVDWERVAAVEVRLRYADPARGVPAREESVLLRADAARTRYERFVAAVVAEEWEYQVSYLLPGGRRVERPWHRSRGTALIVPDLYDRFLVLRWHAPAGFAAASYLVECAHGTERERFALGPDTPEAVWTVGLLPGEDAGFRYRVATVRRDGSAEAGEWTDGSGSQRIPVGPRPAALLSVTVAADLIDFTQVNLARVTLRHAVRGEEDLLFTAGRPREQTWTVPLEPGDRPVYTWSAAFHLAGGEKRAVPPEESAEQTIVLRLPPP